MISKMTALHTAEHAFVVPDLAKRTSFIGSRLACRPFDTSAWRKDGPQPDWLRVFFEHIPDAVFALTGDQRISACNRAAIALFGYEESELLGEKVDIVWCSTPDVQLRGRWEDYGAARPGMTTTKSGDRFPTILTAIREQGEKEIFSAAIFEDLRTEHARLRQLNELQGELARLARMVALGDMTSALAHELSQPLSSILAYSQGCTRLLMNDDRKLDELREALSEITQHALWAGTIVQSIRDFATRGAVEKKPEALHALIHEVSALAVAGSGWRTLPIDLQLQAERDIVVADRVQIAQVLMNLLRNAIEAVDGVQQPRIIVRTRAADPTRLLVEVCDNGCGIAAEVEAGLFRPFVTSKPRGLGMGLALSKRIVEAHGGRITACKGMLAGSVISFSLPLAEIEADGKRPYDPSRR